MNHAGADASVVRDGVLKIVTVVLSCGLFLGCSRSKPAPETKPAPADTTTTTTAHAKPTAQGCDNRTGIDHWLAEADAEVLFSDEGPEEISRGGRVVPTLLPDQTFDGFKLFSVRKDSLMARLGLESGDVVRQLMGVHLGSPTAVLQAYELSQKKWKEGSRCFPVELRRGDQVRLMLVRVR